MAYSRLFLGMLVVVAGACSNEAPTYNPGTAGATAGTSGGGSGGTGGVATGTAIAGALDGYLHLIPCNANSGSGYDCGNIGCMAGTVTQTMQFPIGGVAGQVYDMTFHLRGVVEGYAVQRRHARQRGHDADADHDGQRSLPPRRHAAGDGSERLRLQHHAARGHAGRHRPREQILPQLDSDHAARHHTDYLIFGADYFLAQIKWWLGEQQTLNTFNVGTTLLF